MGQKKKPKKLNSTLIDITFSVKLGKKCKKFILDQFKIMYKIIESLLLPGYLKHFYLQWLWWNLPEKRGPIYCLLQNLQINTWGHKFCSRSWCRECNKARISFPPLSGRKSGGRISTQTIWKLPLWSWYCFMGKGWFRHRHLAWGQSMARRPSDASSLLNRREKILDSPRMKT